MARWRESASDARRSAVRETEFAELLDQVRGIRWPARTAVRSGIPGAHSSRMRGISAEFTEYRPYHQGDDLRRIDWKLFGRTDRAYIRLSNERAILPTTIVLDASASMAFPVDTMGKWNLAALLGVGLAAVGRNGADPVGLMISDAESPVHLPPRTRQGVIQEIIRAVSSVSPRGSAPLAPIVSLAGQSSGRVVIVTDLLGDAQDLLAVASHWVVAGREMHLVHVIAHEELDPPRHDTLVADPENPEYKRPMIRDARDAYIDAFAQWRDEVGHEWSDSGINYTTAVTGEESVDHIIRRVTAVRGAAVPG
ncbi:MAG TPA: DUF58 domain-containing protein [Gemmatimonadaceae bacterium]